MIMSQRRAASEGSGGDRDSVASSLVPGGANTKAPLRLAWFCAACDN
jgi:hypothetical protein